jgi:diguanylate cyclase (GGDEF)-like protein
MASGESGYIDSGVALPRRTSGGEAASDAVAFVPPAPVDSLSSSISSNAGTSTAADSGFLPDLLAVGLGLAVVACALLALRIRAAGRELKQVKQDRDAISREKARLEREVDRIRQAHAQEVEQRSDRLVDENRSLRREQQALKELRTRLEARSERDELTGLLVRRAFEDRLDRELRRALRRGLRHKSPISVVAWTLDESHMLADRLGTREAARVLQQVADVVGAACRRGADNAGRVGPNSFAAVLPGSSLAEAARLAEQVRAIVREMGLPNPGSRARGKVTVSVGVADPDPATGPKAEDVLSALDAACAEAARLGGDQAVKVRMQTAAPRRVAG